MGWFRRGRKDASDHPILVYVFQYPTETACREQWERFQMWLITSDISDWVFSGISEEQGVWFITVVDDTPASRTFTEFPWTGEPCEVDEEYAIEVIVDRRPDLAGQLHFRNVIAPGPRADGTWGTPD